VDKATFAISQIKNSGLSLLKVSTFQTVNLLAQHGLFDRFKSVLTETNLVNYLNNLNQIYEDKPELFLEVVDSFVYGSQKILSEIHLTAEENRFYVSTYAPLLRKIFEYTGNIEYLKSTLPSSKKLILDGFNENDNYKVEKYSKEYEQLLEKINFLKTKVKEFSNQLPRKTQRISSTEQDKEIWIMTQKAKNLEKLAKEIKEAQDSEASEETYVGKKINFNSIFEELKNPWKLRFTPYSIA